MSKQQPSSLDTIEAAAFPVLAAPFNGDTVYVKVRSLNSIQLKGCGDFCLIDLSDPKERRESRIEDVIASINYQEKILEETLIEPTYQDIVNKCYGKDSWIHHKQEKIKEIQAKIEKIKDPKEKRQVTDQVNGLNMMVGYLLPTDFTAYITAWALDIDRAPIKKLTRSILLQAATLASRGKNNPVDHLPGDWTDFHKDQINMTAWVVYDDHVREQKEMKEANKQGFATVRPVK